jgi:hemerythrin-like domain-containing protein
MDSATAMQRLEEYEESLLNHIADEEDLILPLYRERAEIMLGGAPEIFSNEHAKLRTYVELFKAEMPKLIDSKDRERDTLWLLDSQNTFKRLLVHHDVRERKFLYPELDKVMTEREKDDLFARLRLRPVRSMRPIQHNVVVFERTLLS